TCSVRQRAIKCGCFDRPSAKFYRLPLVTCRCSLRTRLTMKKTLLALLLLASAAPLSAQQSIAALPPPVFPGIQAVALRDDALENDHWAWDITEGLTTEVGQRLAATEAEARARNWAVKQLTGMGFSNV